MNKENGTVIRKPKALITITVALTALLVILAGLLMFFYHRLVWTLTLNFNIIYFVWSLFASLVGGLLVLILSIILVKKAPSNGKLFIVPPTIVVFLAVFSLSFALIDRMEFNQHYTFSQERWANATNDERSVYVDSFLKM